MKTEPSKASEVLGEFAMPEGSPEALEAPEESRVLETLPEEPEASEPPKLPNNLEEPN